MNRESLWGHTCRFAGIVCVSALCASAADREPIPVTVVKQGSAWQLQRAGQPYLIKGAGGSSPLDLMVASGANSLRTWGADDLDTLLDNAHARGLSVAVGIWLGHERHGFDYSDGKAVAAQEDKAREAILKYRNHPALLVWGIGNEMEGYADGDNPAIWMAVNRIAAMAHALDPHHPTMTTTTEIGGQRVASVHRFCPEIDIMAINAYGGSRSIPERYRKAGGTKPYIITEFGPAGVWEVGKTSFGAPLEATSTEKATFYADSYKAFTRDREMYLGSYAFVWGHKQEATATWFGMFLPDGSKLGAVDAMTECWSGRRPKQLCPVISDITLVGPNVVRPDSTVTLTLKADDPNGDALTVEWRLQRDADRYNTAGDVQAAPPVIENALVKGDVKGATFKMPRDGGKFRIFAYLRDGKGGAAMANVPIRIDAPDRSGQAADLLSR